MTLKSKFGISILFVWAVFSHQIKAQEIALPENLQETILTLDSDFWKAYNTCDLDNFKTFLTEDLEFYHDKGGLTTTSAKLLEEVANGLCGNENVRLRREAVDGSVHVYPLNNFGAIITGEHVFYLKETGKDEKLIEKAKFTHVWKFENEQWRMSRVLSYDHQQVSENNAKTEVKLSAETLSTYAGQYEAPKTGSVTITLSAENTLHMDAGQMKAQLHPESESLFFIKEAPITLEFVKDATGKTVKFIVRESGNVVEEALRKE